MTQHAATPLRVLIAEGNDRFRKDLRETLERAGYLVVFSSGDGAKIVTAAQDLRPDLILLDAHLPDLNSLDAARLLQQEHIAPTVLLTVEADAVFIRRAAEAGIFSCLVKPIQEASLIPALEIARHQWVAWQKRDKRVQWLKEQDQTRAVVDCAKKLLMETCGYSETKAYHFIQTRSMNSRRSMRVVAEAILLSHQLLHGDSKEDSRASARREAAA